MSVALIADTMLRELNYKQVIFFSPKGHPKQLSSLADVQLQKDQSKKQNEEKLSTMFSFISITVIEEIHGIS
ncbi:hypothetical protein BTVI_148493 [Pitangus sulphuratus]|nr:hypothetical protein BTVI_148493 [Pitangus sulphuratus]